ncbi:MAG: alkyl/aryl-sulfatase [Pseudomonadota bacterium]
MKAKIVIVVQLVIIVALAAGLLTRYISLRETKPVVREPRAPGEATLSYTPPPPPAFSVDSLKRLAEFKKEFTPAVDKITDRIYLARGFALGNVGLVVTDEGLVVVDATESRAAAGDILARFREITDLPVKYIIYTHAHPDHVFGTPVFFQPGVEVIATREAARLMDDWYGTLQPFVDRCRENQAGRLAPEYAFKLPFAGPFKPEEKRELIRPTIVFDEEYAFDLGGVRFELFHTQGETTDHLMIVLPGEKALFPGDLYYYSFPNLSTPMLEARPVKEWHESLDRMIALKPQYLVPGHGRAIVGEENILGVLANYSRAIRFVREETIKAVNQGLSAAEAVERVKLPADLAGLPFLQEYYGRVDWAVRGLYRGLTGWYDGRGTGLNPLPPRHLAGELVGLAGGADKLLARAMALQNGGEHQLACEVCDVVLAANPGDKTARVIKAVSLDYLGALSGNLNMFGFYRSAAALERAAAGVKP